MSFNLSCAADKSPGKQNKIKVTSGKGVLSKEAIEGMVKEANKFHLTHAKNGLDSYCFNMKTTLDDEKVKDKISEDDRKAISDKCDEAIKWLDANQLAEMEEFNKKQKEVEGVCNSIMINTDDHYTLHNAFGPCLIAPPLTHQPYGITQYTLHCSSAQPPAIREGSK